MNIAEQAVAFAAELVAAGIQATADPRAAATSKGRGGVFVPPPRRLYRDRADEWTLVVYSSSRSADLATFRTLAELLDELEAVLPIEEAEPSRYQLVSDQPPVPAFLARFVSTI